MEYRSFGKLDWKVSALGFGCMRLPVLDMDNTRIDEVEAMRMVRHAIDSGVNYVDTAYTYHGGMSEHFLSRALKDGYREKVALATKLPSWKVKETADFDRFLDEQLEKLQTDHIDFYLLHTLNAEYWKNLRGLNVLNWVEQARASGRIRHIGFSFHDKLNIFKEIIDDYAGWDFAQIQYNYMDINEQAGTEGLKYAAECGLGVIVMEPLLGGRLVKSPESVQALWNTAPTRRSAADWALQWLWNQPEVSLVLSGMSTMQQVEENLVSASASGVNRLSGEEKALVDQVRAKYQEMCQVPCTRCGYCQPCPNSVNIPRIFELYNESSMYDRLEEARRDYAGMPLETRADVCIACQECEEKCPQHISITTWLPVVHEALKARS
jgi:uncharacterized protein